MSQEYVPGLPGSTSPLRGHDYKCKVRLSKHGYVFLQVHYSVQK